jgi:CRP/FNR family transcriptional regulator, cyclic AMP receptor protein
MAIRGRPEDDGALAVTRPSRIALLQVDAGLRAAVPQQERPLAERAVHVPCHELGPGPWRTESVRAGGDTLAALVVRGLGTREITIAGRRSAELLGPGDVFHPWSSSNPVVPSTSRWASGSRATIAVLDGRFLAAARRWPELFAVVHERLAEQLERATMRAAIMSLPRVEQRILGIFWQLAERWGTVRSEGVVVELAITHELIGQLIGAQRPTVSLALQALAGEGHLQRTSHDAWILRHDSRDHLPGVRMIGAIHTAVAPETAGAEGDRGGYDEPMTSVADG